MAKPTAEYAGIKIVVNEELKDGDWMLVSVVAGRICVANPNCVMFFDNQFPIRPAPRIGPSGLCRHGVMRQLCEVCP